MIWIPCLVGFGRIWTKWSQWSFPLTLHFPCVGENELTDLQAGTLQARHAPGQKIIQRDVVVLGLRSQAWAVFSNHFQLVQSATRWKAHWRSICPEAVQVPNHRDKLTTCVLALNLTALLQSGYVCHTVEWPNIRFILQNYCSQNWNIIQKQV